MSELDQNVDTALDAVLENFGTGVRAGVTKVKELVDEYTRLKFDTRRATTDDIAKNFSLLHRIYTVTLTAPEASRYAAINYLARRFANGRADVFGAIRVNMMPNVEKGGSKMTSKYVADLNQLFGALVHASNATQLRAIVRVDKILESIRSPEQRQALEHYISSIDH